MTVHSCHTVLAGTEDRQLLYVALTRGRQGNHVYLAPPADAEPDLLPRAESATGLHVVQAILARDGAQESATTVRRNNADPGTQLHDAVLRYQDALELAMRWQLGVAHLDQLERGGPLPWLPCIPPELAVDPGWGTYLQERADRIARLASRIPTPATATWIHDVEPNLRKEIAVWRAAYAIPSAEIRPTGPRVEGVGWHYQRALEQQIGKTASNMRFTDEWSELLPAEVTDDPAVHNLKHRLSGLASEGAQVSELIPLSLRADQSLPAENPADALWWRIVAADAASPRHEATRVPAPRMIHQRTKPYEALYARPNGGGPEVRR
jgi:hypothetical protein